LNRAAAVNSVEAFNQKPQDWDVQFLAGYLGTPGGGAFAARFFSGRKKEGITDVSMLYICIVGGPGYFSLCHGIKKKRAETRPVQKIGKKLKTQKLAVFRLQCWKGGHGGANLGGVEFLLFFPFRRMGGRNFVLCWGGRALTTPPELRGAGGYFFIFTAHGPTRWPVVSPEPRGGKRNNPGTNPKGRAFGPKKTTERFFFFPFGNWALGKNRKEAGF